MNVKLQGDILNKHNVQGEISRTVKFMRVTRPSAALQLKLQLFSISRAQNCSFALTEDLLSCEGADQTYGLQFSNEELHCK